MAASTSSNIVLLLQKRVGSIKAQQIYENILYSKITCGVSYQKAARDIEDLLQQSNYYCVFPSVWKIKKPTPQIFTDHFISDMHNFQSLNDIPPKKEGSFRIMTYNVHFWTRPGELKTSHSQILEMISQLKPDIIGLQEVLMPVTLGRITQKDVYTSDGRRIKRVFGSLVDQGYTTYLVPASRAQCGSYTAFGNAFLTRSNRNVQKVNSLILPSPEEDRCAIFTRYRLPTGQESLFVTVHLDVYDTTGETRREHMSQILTKIDKEGGSDPVILWGDFNCLRREDYSASEIDWFEKNSLGDPDFETIQMVEDAGFTDLFGTLKYTVWTGRRVDFIFARNFPYQPIEKFIYYSDASDHIPLIIDFSLTQK